AEIKAQDDPADAWDRDAGVVGRTRRAGGPCSRRDIPIRIGLDDYGDARRGLGSALGSGSWPVNVEPRRAAPSGRGYCRGADRSAEGSSDDVHDLVHVGIGLAALGGGPDTSLDVILQDEDRQRVDGRAQGRRLLEDVDAVLVALDHPRDAPDLALHSGEPAA